MPTKKGESDPLFNPSGLKKRTTVMGLAPAPHSAPPPAPPRPAGVGKSTQIGPHAMPNALRGTQIGLPVMPSVKQTGPADAEYEPVAGGERGKRTGSSPAKSTYLGLPKLPGLEDRAATEPPDAEVESPTFGATTLLMKSAAPSEAGLPSSSGWDVAPPHESPPNMPSAPTVLLEPATPDPNRSPSRDTARHMDSFARYHMDDFERRHSRDLVDPQAIVDASPVTERMRAAPRAQPPVVGPARPVTGPAIPAYAPPPPIATPAAPGSPQTQAMQPPATAAPLALRPYEPAYGPPPPVPLAPLDRRLVLLHDPDSARAASFRLLRDSLVAKNLPRVVAVTSVSPHDGKTTCAINLAMALSEQSATRVLLVDANFYEPELGLIFQLDALPAVTPPQAWLAPYTIAAITPTFHVAGIRRADMHQSRRFEQQRFEAMIDNLCRANYDYLILDTPALKDAPAVVSLITGSDGTLLAVRSNGATTGRDLKRTAEQIPANKGLGIALMDV